MGLVDGLREEFAKHERDRVREIWESDEKWARYRDAVAPLARERAEIGRATAPVEGDIDIDVSAMTAGIVVPLVDDFDRSDHFEVLVVGEPDEERLDVYVVGTCPDCDHRVPLAPVIDSDSPIHSAGLALTANMPAELHVCRGRQ